MRRLFSGAAAMMRQAKATPPTARSGRIVLTLLLMLLTTATAWADTGDEADGVYYIGADGTLKNTATDGIDGNDTPTALDIIPIKGLPAGWYVVTEDFVCGYIVTTGEVHLILADGKTLTVTVSNGSAINLSGDLTIYGQSLGTGKLIANGSLCGISANIGCNLTINGGNVTATGGDHGINVDDVTINGGIVSATGGYYGIYAQNNITLGGGIVTASSYEGTVNLNCGYRNADGTETVGSGDEVRNYGGETLYPDLSVSYLDAYGDPATVESEDYKILEGNELYLDEGWYVVYGTVSYDRPLPLDGDVNLILADGCTMNIGSTDRRISGNGIYGYYGYGSYYNLDIYGQTNGTGKLKAYVTGDSNAAILAGDITVNGGDITAEATGQNADAINAISEVTINGGTVSATATGTGSTGIRSQQSSIYINGGTVTASGQAYDLLADDLVEIYGGTVRATGNTGIYAGAGITLGWNKPTDRIYASSYDADGGTISIADGKAFVTDDATPSVVSGTLSYADRNAIGGKTLRPAVILADDASNATAISDAVTACTGSKTLPVQLSGRTLSKSGEWNTLCLPFDVEDGDLSDGLSFSGTPLEGATVKELNATTSNLDNGTLTLNFTPANSIEAGKPYIVRWGTPDDNPGGTIVDPVFSGVTVSSTAPTAVNFTGGSFVGQYSPFSITAGNIDEIILLSTGNRLGYSQNPRTLRSFRAHFEIPTSGGVREFVLNFDEENTTGIISPAEIKEITEMAGAWYSLDGRKLDAKPTKKGLYIHNGKKVVIK